MSTSITSALATPEQLKQLERMLDDIFANAKKLVYSKTNPDKLEKAAMQRLLENGDEIKSAVAETAVAKVMELSVTNKYKDEQRSSNYTYPKEYKGPKPIGEQIKAIAKIFDLDPASALEYAKNLPALPDGAEGWFAFPSIEALAKKHFPDVKDDNEKYCRAILLVLEKIAALRSFYNYRDGQITRDRLRLSARTAQALADLALEQKGDILIVAAQLGMRHRGRSTRRACEVFVANEFGLGSVIGGSVALTHPKRFVRFEELDMDLPGDQFDDPDSGVRWDLAPCLRFDGGKVGFGTTRVVIARGYYGSASGWVVPQPK